MRLKLNIHAANWGLTTSPQEVGMHGWGGVGVQPVLAEEPDQGVVDSPWHHLAGRALPSEGFSRAKDLMRREEREAGGIQLAGT